MAVLQFSGAKSLRNAGVADDSPPERACESEPFEYPARTNVLGVGISAVDMRQALSVVKEWISTGAGQYVCVTGVHGVVESQRDPALRRVHNAAGLVTPDGMPMVWLSRIAGHKHVERVYGPEFMAACCRLSVSEGYRHYFYGGGDGVAEKLRDRLCERFPGLQVVGTLSPPFRELSREEDDAIVARINQSNADIVWVGLSTPKQERWMSSHRERLHAPVFVGVGAAFDFLAGLKKQAPAWMRRSGLEWLFRLLTEPRRLGPRYIVNNPVFLWMLAGQVLGVRRYSL